MTRSYWTTAAAAVIAFGVGVMMSAHASGDTTDPELAVLQQIEKNTETTNTQLTLLNAQITKLATSLAAAEKPSNAGVPPSQNGSATNQAPPPVRN